MDCLQELKNQVKGMVGYLFRREVLDHWALQGVVGHHVLHKALDLQGVLGHLFIQGVLGHLFIQGVPDRLGLQGVTDHLGFQ